MPIINILMLTRLPVSQRSVLQASRVLKANHQKGRFPDYSGRTLEGPLTGKRVYTE